MNRLEGLDPTRVEVEIEEAFHFVPGEFTVDPFGYFEREGVNIKSGEVKLGEDGRVREDPTATKDLPEWASESGERIQAVGKLVNTEKSQIGKSGDPFYEYKVMKEVKSRIDAADDVDVKIPAPIARAKQGESHLIVMERVEGYRANSIDIQRLVEERGLQPADVESLHKQAQEWADKTNSKLASIGVIRKLAPKDMIFQIHPEELKIIGAVPVDWERTKLVDPE